METGIRELPKYQGPNVDDVVTVKVPSIPELAGLKPLIDGSIVIVKKTNGFGGFSYVTVDHPLGIKGELNLPIAWLVPLADHELAMTKFQPLAAD